jgi:hypothetical protein
MAAAGTVRLRALLAQRGRGGGGAQLGLPGLPGLGGGGHLVVTPGNETDFDRIEGDILTLQQWWLPFSQALAPSPARGEP